MPRECNIDARGKFLRLVGGSVSLTMAIVAVGLLYLGLIPSNWFTISSAIGLFAGGALGIYDDIISQQSLEAEDVIEQVHQVLTGGRLNLPEKQLISALAALSDCDVRLRRSSQGRIQVEKMLHEFASIQQQ